MKDSANYIEQGRKAVKSNYDDGVFQQLQLKFSFEDEKAGIVFLAECIDVLFARIVDLQNEIKELKNEKVL